MKEVIISLAFARLGDDPLADFALNIFNKMSGNAAFATPAITMPVLGAAQLLFRNSIPAIKDGGHPAALAKTAAREDLIAKLRVLAAYVENLPGITPAVAATSGFILRDASTHTPKMPAVPTIVKVFNVASTKLGVKIIGTPRVRFYEFRVTVEGKAPVPAGSFPSTLDIVLTDLVPGVIYAVQCRAGVGNKVFSEWSDPVSHMCT